MDEKVAGIFKPVAKCTNVKPKQMWITFATQVRSVLKTIKYSGIKKKKKNGLKKGGLKKFGFHCNITL